MPNDPLAAAEPEPNPAGAVGTHVLTPTDHQNARAAQQVMNKARRQIETAARKAVEALAVHHPETLHLEVGDVARLAATRIAVDLVAGTVPGSQLAGAAQAVRTLVEVARLEAGKHTTLTANVNANASDLQAMLDSVRREVASSTVSVAADCHDPSDSATSKGSETPSK